MEGAEACGAAGYDGARVDIFSDERDGTLLAGELVWRGFGTTFWARLRAARSFAEGLHGKTSARAMWIFRTPGTVIRVGYEIRRR